MFFYNLLKKGIQRMWRTKTLIASLHNNALNPFGHLQQLKNYELTSSLGRGYLMAIRIQLESVYNGRSVRG